MTIPKTFSEIIWEFCEYRRRFSEMAFNHMPASRVRLPCYAGFNQFAIWPSPDMVTLEDIYIFSMLTFIEFFLLWTTWCQLDHVPQPKWAVGWVTFLSWIYLCSISSRRNKPGGTINFFSSLTYLPLLFCSYQVLQCMVQGHRDWSTLIMNFMWWIWRWK